MKLSTYVQLLRDTFFERLERKTGWGKEEVKKEFNEATEAILMDMLSKEEE